MLKICCILLGSLILVKGDLSHQPNFDKAEPDDRNFQQTITGSERVINNNGNLSYFREKCINNLCTTCIDNSCYNSTNFSEIKIAGNCPISVCLKNCTGFVLNTDNCPVCKCDGFATRELCVNNEDCPSANCEMSVCKYPAVADDLPKYCTFSYECPANQKCQNSTCKDSATESEHVEGTSCIFDFMCPANYSCSDMTCWLTGSDHLEGRNCVFNSMCPKGYRCRRMTCHRYKETDQPSLCIFDMDCPQGQVCRKSVCINNPRPTNNNEPLFPLFGNGDGFKH